MNKLFVGLAKLAVVSSGPASVIYSTLLFDRYFDAGMEASSATHSVEINNHGSYRYITESQDREISIYLGVGVALLVVLFAMIILEIRRKAR